jgi:TolB protein
MRVRKAPILAGALVMSMSVMPTANAVFPGDNGRIAFTRADRIFVMDEDGSNTERLRTDASEPAWSADGAHIAFSAFRDSGRSDIFMMDADGSNVTALTRFRPGYNLAPSWAPSGRRLVFIHNTAEGTDLYVLRLTDGRIRQLTTSPRLVERAPEWSPDGDHIVFSRFRETGTPTDEDVFVVDPDGADITRLTTTRTNDFQPSWSPDAAQVIYVRDTSRHGTTLFVMDADGGNVTKLTPDDTEEFWPVFSPDGTRVAFSRCADFTCDIYTMDPDGSNLTQLTSGDRLESRPDWQAV